MDFQGFHYFSGPAAGTTIGNQGAIDLYHRHQPLVERSRYRGGKKFLDPVYFL
jgi:hypothetical protein